jgi:hypothetical protein
MNNSQAPTSMARPTTSGFGGGGKGSSGTSPVAPKGHQPDVTWGGGELVRYNIDGGGGSGIVAVAIATLQALVAYEQYQIAKSYYNTNKQDFDFYVNNYQNPMLSHKNQAFSTPFYTADYLPMTGASLGRLKTYDEKWLQSRRRAHRYALGHQRHIDYMYYMIRRRAAFAAWIAGRRIEDARKDWKDDQIQTHKIQALNFGITAGNIARQGLASATGAIEGAYDELGTRLGGLSSGAGRYSGYQSGRNSKKVLDASSGSGAAMAPHTVGPQ